MADISFLVFQDDKGFYRLEGSDPNNQTRVDMTEQEANAQQAAQHNPAWDEGKEPGETMYYFKAEIRGLVSGHTFTKEEQCIGDSEEHARDFVEYTLEQEYPGEAYQLLSLECLSK